MKKLLLIALLIVGCAINSQKDTIYFMGMSVEEFKKKNKGLKLVEQNENGIVYLRKECSECNPQYYTFIYGKLEAVTPFHAGLDKMQFDLKPPEPVEPEEPKDPVEGVMPIMPEVKIPVTIPEVPEQPEAPEKIDEKTEDD